MPEPLPPQPGVKLWSFIALATSVCLGTAVYVAARYRQYTAPIAAPTSPVGSGAPLPSATLAAPTLTQLRSQPHVYFRSAKRAEYGQIILASLGRPDLERAQTQLNCERFAFAGEHGICVIDNRIHLTPPAKALLVDAELRVERSIDLAGIPSRARVSSDGRYAVATVFTSGDDYESEFSTRTTLLDAHTGAVVADLEQFRVTRDGRVISEVDFNFWGVSFKRDSNQFYATLASKGKTYLIDGDIAARQAKVLRQNVECPSVSPNQSLLVFKSRVTDGTQGWRLHALELASGAEWELQSEARSVDDQVEWLDDEHVLYRILEDRGLPEQALNTWSLPVARDAREAPVLFSHGASSPSVQRSGIAEAAAP